MKIVRLDLPVLKDCDDTKFVDEAHCSKLTANEMQDAHDFMVHCVYAIPGEDLKVDENTFCFTVFDEDCYQIVGLLGVSDKPMDFQKYNMGWYSGNSERIFHEIEYVVADKRLLTESFLEHALQIVLMSIVDKENESEEVLWFDFFGIPCAKVLDKYHKQYGYYFVPESIFFAEKIIERAEKETNRINYVINKIK